MSGTAVITTPTCSGRLFTLGLDSNAGVVRIRDIAAHLSRSNRWAGATEAPISVAQHSVLVAEECERSSDFKAGLYGLLHDAHEYIIGDTTRPIKRWLEQRCGFDPLAELAASVDAEIFSALGIDWPMPETYHRAIKAADERVLATEWRDLMPDAFLPMPVIRPLPRTIKPWSWPVAEERWLAKYADLCALTGAPNMLETI